jgi:hypothetical protein
MSNVSRWVGTRQAESRTFQCSFGFLDSRSEKDHGQSACANGWRLGSLRRIGTAVSHVPTYSEWRVTLMQWHVENGLREAERGIRPMDFSYFRITGLAVLVYYARGGCRIRAASSGPEVGQARPEETSDPLSLFLLPHFVLHLAFVLSLLCPGRFPLT